MRKLLVALAGVLTLSGQALAADLPVKAAPLAAIYDWTGFYLGGHVGYAWTSPTLSAADRAAITATYGAVPEPQGFAAGLHMNYDYQMPSNVVFGLGFDVNGFGIKSVSATTGIGAASSLKSTIDWDFALYGRLGLAYGRILPYLLGGVAFDHNKVSGFNGFIGAFSVDNWHTGLTLGGGINVALWERWSGRIQYRYVTSSKENYLGRQIGSDASLIDFGLSYRL